MKRHGATMDAYYQVKGGVLRDHSHVTFWKTHRKRLSLAAVILGRCSEHRLAGGAVFLRTARGRGSTASGPALVLRSQHHSAKACVVSDHGSDLCPCPWLLSSSTARRPGDGGGGGSLSVFWGIRLESVACCISSVVENSRYYFFSCDLYIGLFFLWL